MWPWLLVCVCVYVAKGSTGQEGGTLCKLHAEFSPSEDWHAAFFRCVYACTARRFCRKPYAALVIDTNCVAMGERKAGLSEEELSLDAIVHTCGTNGLGGGMRSLKLGTTKTKDHIKKISLISMWFQASS